MGRKGLRSNPQAIKPNNKRDKSSSQASPKATNRKRAHEDVEMDEAEDSSTEDGESNEYTEEELPTPKRRRTQGGKVPRSQSIEYIQEESTPPKKKRLKVGKVRPSVSAVCFDE